MSDECISELSFVAQAFQPAGFGDFPVPSPSVQGNPWNTELESSGNSQAGKPALRRSPFDKVWPGQYSEIRP